MGGSVSLIDGHIDEVLKPCPFCGGKAFVDVHSFWNEDTQDFTDHTYGAGCEVCLVKTVSFYNTEAEAIGAWNRRADT